MMIGLVLVIIGYLVRLIVCNQQKNNSGLWIAEPHKLITTGCYKYIRHPMYLGSMFIICGLSLLLANWKIMILIGYLTYNWLFARALQEEYLLLNVFGDEYYDYIKKTKRIIPFIL